jgi:hypothetical protein
MDSTGAIKEIPTLAAMRNKGSLLEHLSAEQREKHEKGAG